MAAPPVLGPRRRRQGFVLLSDFPTESGYQGSIRYCSRTKIAVNGIKAERKAVKLGMNYTFNYPVAGEEAKNIDGES